jgi:hypothetical protein
MKTTDRKSPARVVLPVSLVLVGLFGGLAANAADGTQPGDANASCHQETRRFAVWPKTGNPKFKQVASVEERVVTVCNGKVVSQPERNASNQAKG